MYKYLIWDVDGTIFDTYPAFVRAFGQTLKTFGVDEPPEEIMRLFKISRKHCLEVIVPRHELDEDALVEKYLEMYRAVPLEEQPPFPGVRRICEQVVARGGQNFIVTHRGSASLVLLLAQFEMTDLFTEQVTHDDGHPRKPDPAAFLAVIDKYSLPREQVLAVGDRALDVQAGQNAGVATCYFDAEPPPGNMTPTYAVTTYTELEALLFPS
jgi:HAD superfamily hydrolase (TIGR01509 family)